MVGVDQAGSLAGKPGREQLLARDVYETRIANEAVAIGVRQTRRLEVVMQLLHGVEPPEVEVVQDVQRLADKLSDRRKRLKIVINNAGVGGFSAPLHETDPETWDKIMNTNLRGVYHMIRAFAPALIANGGGDIVNISSLAGKNALPNGATYSASKWGLNGLSYSVAEELRGHNIRVTVVCPGSVNTDLSPHTGKNTSKMLQPGDIAHVVGMVVTQASQSFASEILLRPTQKP